MKTVSIKRGSRIKVEAGPNPQTPMTITTFGQSEGGHADVHARISQLAYSLYEQRGRAEGRHLEDWLTAEQRILGGHS